MDLILWRDAFCTGYNRIDNEHKNLVRLINELFNNLSAKEKDEKMKRIFMELYDYTIHHFSMEESVMREFGYSGYQKHKEEHSQFIISIQDFREKFLLGQAKVNVDMLNFLKDWLIKHIMGTDKNTFEEIKSKTY